uniref:EGF-like domain-containing protein n=1 Tax=Syphacia muris TaxID=451379 RepID=A0A158R634_9BILA
MLFFFFISIALLSDTHCDSSSSNKSSDYGKCECTERFEGEQCEIEPCLNDGIKASDSTCHCPWGTIGDRCEKVTYCIESNGRLENGKCICADRFSGLFCQIRLCHNGDFVRKGKNGYCKCDKGYTGPFCSERLICQHGHINDENKCVCDANWTGERCERCAIGLFSCFIVYVLVAFLYTIEMVRKEKELN